jgi:KDO2-lipid IV(A) lauroyltransferase
MLPWSAAQRLGSGLGLAIYCLIGRYRRVAYRNLERVYGDSLSRAERGRMVRDVYRHFGKVGFEFLKLPQMSRTDIESIVRVENEDHLKEAFQDGKGVLLVTGHFGNWEVMARWLTTHDYPLNVVARRANDPEADKLLTSTREGAGAHVFTRGNSVRGILQSLKRNEIVALLPDQNAADIVVPFMGLSTGTVDGPAVIHLKTGAPILFSWCVRDRDDKFVITFEEPYRYDAANSLRPPVEEVMAEVNARLSAQIRSHPTQWLWLHNRWKSSPGGEDAPANGTRVRHGITSSSRSVE